jgi:hypothetical protein
MFALSDEDYAVEWLMTAAVRGICLNPACQTHEPNEREQDDEQ